jgi:hypothetical protein
MLKQMVRRKDAVRVGKQKVWRSAGCNTFVATAGQLKTTMLVRRERHRIIGQSSRAVNNIRRVIR